MIGEQEDTLEELQRLTLAEILERDDLCLEEILTVKDIHNKIKKQMKIFVDYCKIHESFTDRLISLGLKCPMHESTNDQMKNVTYIAADVLTSDHEAVADLLILANRRGYDSDDEGEIAEEIETEDTTPPIPEADKYKFLNKILDYIQGESLEENCLNYIVKSLQILVRKKLNAFLEYFHQFPEVLARLTQISHFPSVSHLLAKLLTDEEDDMTALAIETKSKILPLLLQKVHSSLTANNTIEVFQSLEEVLQSSRYGDAEERSQLQTLSDIMVSSEELSFHINNISNATRTPTPESLCSIFNSVTYINMVITRMNMDEQHDYSQELQPFKPTLKYEVDQVFMHFCKFIASIYEFEKFKAIDKGLYKLATIKFMELLSSLTKHSRFGSFYELIPKVERLDSIRYLISNVARRKLSGILLQIGSSLIEKIILEEERIAETHPESSNKISPSDMYQLISDHQFHLQDLVHEFAHENPKQRNKNEQGIYLRKLLVVFDNFFKNTEIHKHFPEIETITKLFPVFSAEKCKKYADLTAIANHPGGIRAKTPVEFKFMQRSQNFLKNLIVDEVDSKPEMKVVQQQKKSKEGQMMFKLQGKIKTLKDRVREKQAEKVSSQQQPTPSRPSPTSQGECSGEVKMDSPTRHNSPQPCLLFFIRHLAIY